MATSETGGAILLTPGDIGARNEVLRGLGTIKVPEYKGVTAVEKHANQHLLRPGKEWVSSDVLVEGSQEAIAREALALPSIAVVGFAGDMITEAVIINYATPANRVEGMRDETGVDDTAWGWWIRRWLAEELTHAHAGRDYARDSGIVHMRAFDRSTKALVANGFRSRFEIDPYRGIQYPTGQELDTKIAHGRNGDIAKHYHAKILHRLLQKISSDEGRHYLFYLKMGEELMEQDPVGAIISFWNLLVDAEPMPAANVTDGRLFISEKGKPSDEFFAYAAAAHFARILTASDHYATMAEIATQWDIEHRLVHGDAAKAQEKIMKYVQKDRSSADQTMDGFYRRRFRAQGADPEEAVTIAFAWIGGKYVPLDRGVVFQSPESHIPGKKEKAQAAPNGAEPDLDTEV